VPSVSGSRLRFRVSRAMRTLIHRAEDAMREWQHEYELESVEDTLDAVETQVARIRGLLKNA
jgi:exonuclease VII large subunit